MPVAVTHFSRRGVVSFPWHPGDGASRLLNSWSEDGKVKNPVDDF